MFRDYRIQILLSILPLAIVVTVVAYLGVNSHQAAMRQMVSDRDSALARVGAAEWSDALASHARLLPTLAPDPQALCAAACLAFDGGVALFDRAGNLVRAQPAADVWAGRRARVAALLASPGVAFSNPFDDAGSTRVLVSVPTDQGVLVGAFASPTLADLGLGGSAAAYVVDGQGRIIWHPDPARLGEDLSQHDGIAQVIHGVFGATLHRDARGIEFVIGYAPIAPTGWGVVIEEPWANFVDPIFQYSVLLPLALLAAAVLALISIYFGVRNVIRPLHNLAQTANRIAFGNYHAAAQPVGGIREIEELRETLDSMARQLETAQAAMQSYLGAITRGQEDERMRLARELHDDTIQSLIALQQRIEMVQKATARDPVAAAAKMQELKELLSESLTSVRRFVRDLRPTYLDELGLIPALETLTHEARARFQARGDEARLDAERELVIFRIVQEALRNVSKHARAKDAAVTLLFEPNAVTATIEDDGIGFDAPESSTGFAQAGHFGLMGMQERAQLLGGNIYVRSERGKGTKVVAYVPLKHPAVDSG